MDWIERVENIEFKIVTGDGEVFLPLYKGGEKETEFNVSDFNFINVAGTLRDRKKSKSPFFNLVFYFEGLDNIEQSNRLDASSMDSRPWTVTHPFYGVISGHPISIKRNDSSLNITEVTVPFWESIDADYPLTNDSVEDSTKDKHSAVYQVCALSFVKPVFSSVDISKLKSNVYDISGETKAIQNSTTYAEFQNGLNKALKGIDSLLSNPLSTIQKIQNFLDLPSVYEQAVAGRIAGYENIYYRLKSSIKTLADKKYFEAAGGSIIASMSLVAVTPIEGDYVLISDIVKITLKIATIHDDYLKTMDELKVSNYDVTNRYNQDASVLNEVNSLVSFTIANLYRMTFEAKTERIVYTDKETNVILLVHRYLGMDESDENIDNFIKTNKIKLNELFAIKKGREIRFAK